MSELECLIVRLYKQGYSIKAISDYVFSYKKRNYPKNSQFQNFYIDNNKKYTRLDCYSYVSRVILTYNSNMRKRFLNH